VLLGTGAAALNAYRNRKIAENNARYGPALREGARNPQPASSSPVFDTET